MTSAQSKRAEIHSTYPLLSSSDITKKLGEMWNALRSMSELLGF